MQSFLLPPDAVLSRDKEGNIKLSYGKLTLTIAVLYSGTIAIIDHRLFVDHEWSTNRIAALQAGTSFTIKCTLEYAGLLSMSTNSARRLSVIEDYVVELENELSYNLYRQNHNPALFLAVTNIAREMRTLSNDPAAK
jgi:hypothetical protein